MRRIIGAVFALCVIGAVAVFTGCSEDKPVVITVDTVIANPFTCAFGDTVIVTATYTYEGEGTVNLTWSSDDGTIHTTSDNKIIKWVAPSTAGWYTVTVTASDGSEQATGHVVIEVLSETQTYCVFSSFRSGTWQIYVCNPPDTHVTQLTTIGANTVPKLSPDKSKIIFISERSGLASIWTMDIDGANQQLLYEETGYACLDPKYSNDGLKIAFSRRIAGTGCPPCPTTEIFTMGVDGTNVQQLTDNNYREQDPIWAPDDSRLIIARSQSADDCCNATDIYFLQFDGTLTPFVTGSDYQWAGTWSNEGIVYTDLTPSHLIKIVEEDGSGTLTLHDFGSSVYDDVFSHVGNLLIGDESNGGEITYNIWTMNDDGTNYVVFLTDNSGLSIGDWK